MPGVTRKKLFRSNLINDISGWPFENRITIKCNAQGWEKRPEGHTLALGIEKHMLRGFTIAAAVLCVTAAALSGCAENYPRLPDLTKMNDVLSPKERDQTIKDLTTEQSANGAAATKMPEGQK